jgi:hypothetical protein
MATPPSIVYATKLDIERNEQIMNAADNTFYEPQNNTQTAAARECLASLFYSRREVRHLAYYCMRTSSLLSNELAT